MQRATRLGRGKEERGLLGGHMALYDVWGVIDRMVPIHMAQAIALGFNGDNGESALKLMMMEGG